MKELEKLYRECFQDVYRYLCKLCGDSVLAEELTSQTFFKAMGALDSFRGECEARIWLCRIAKNCFYSHLKKSGRETSLDSCAPEADATLASPEDILLQRSEAERVRSALHSLSESYREVFMRRFYGGLSFAETGAIFGKSENWACVTYHRARKMIIKRLEEY